MTMYKTLSETCLAYLETIVEMSEIPGMYALDKMRTDLHDDLAELTGFDRDKLSVITSNLNTLFDFNPPLERFDSVKVYARDLCSFLTSPHCRMAMNGKVKHFRTVYGEVPVNC